MLTLERIKTGKTLPHNEKCQHPKSDMNFYGYGDAHLYAMTRIAHDPERVANLDIWDAITPAGCVFDNTWPAVQTTGGSDRSPRDTRE